MTFIRIKKINNASYAYLVESINTNKGPRQKVKQYLGRVHHFPKNETESNINEKNILLRLVLEQLKNHGFKNKGKLWKKEQITFCSSTMNLKKKNKEAILALNEGFLATFTLLRIKNFRKTKDLQKDAHLLAKYFLETGLNITKEDFISCWNQIPDT